MDDHNREPPRETPDIERRLESIERIAWMIRFSLFVLVIIGAAILGVLIRGVVVDF